MGSSILAVVAVVAEEIASAMGGASLTSVEAPLATPMDTPAAGAAARAPLKISFCSLQSRSCRAVVWHCLSERVWARILFSCRPSSSCLVNNAKR